MESIFDGWKTKIEMSLLDGRGGFCARGWIRHYYGVPQDVNGSQHAEIADTERRLADWIAKHLPVPRIWTDTPGGIIAYANNAGLLNIEGFRRVDLLTRGFEPEETPEPVPEIADPEEVEITEPPEILEPVAA